MRLCVTEGKVTFQVDQNNKDCMEVVLFLSLIFVFLFFSNSSKKSNTKTTLDPEFQKWISEHKSGQTNLTFREWKSENFKAAIETLNKKNAQNFSELIVLGRELQHIKRQGTARQFSGSFHEKFTKSFGIHPEEVSLIEREKVANKLLRSNFEISRLKKPTLSGAHLPKSENIGQESKAAPITQEERAAALIELSKIDYEWCVLNNRLLDDFYSENIKSVSRDDFSLTYHEPQQGSKFPYAAGQWTAKSKRFGFKIFDGSITRISATSTSKNQAIALAIENIASRKSKFNDLISVPLDPMEVDL